MERYVIFFWSMLVAVKGEFCGKLGDKEFYCEEGHCCGDMKCCTYYQYYEMWWFWLLWVIIILLGCTCVYYKRHYAGPYSRMSNYWYAMMNVRPAQTTNQPGITQFKLPTYEEVIQMSQLGPPEDHEGAPPPYGDFTEQQNNNSRDGFTVNSQLLQEASVRGPIEDIPPEYTPGVVPNKNT
ncbi:WW domain-binding protein 1-like [Actinia tenebrosa]|uniref:WW domain-binding protein 1-like n=1 Tax=Actinia tenebrosa TaxID=6105 RepID=A0A6P8ITD2_ACTTE|nr:WW domain-binding protein 1-like [Actinia tenebrosa]